MKIKILAVAAIFLILCNLCGCDKVDSGTKNFLIEGDNQTINNRFIKIPEEDNLYYDSNTTIVYVIFYTSAIPKDVGKRIPVSFMSVYYADNGKPYKYNVEERKLIKIS